ncbi:hypothetical protein C3489_08340 [Streptomyces sp. Ru71]|uniref:HNH endonuclease signature motif containing protein n=1 Tax=Streptomyces sp. Ru71 TaxID=2080746 RepID=UPI000CDD53D0|nr:hypothetical protein C3489_08340 [Streptomyces sp. Ru71]
MTRYPVGDGLPAWLQDPAARARALSLPRPRPKTGHVVMATGSGKTASFLPLVVQAHRTLPLCVLDDYADSLPYTGILVNGNSRALALSELWGTAARIGPREAAEPPLPLSPMPYERRRLRVLRSDEHYVRVMARAEQRERDGLDRQRTEQTITRRVRSMSVRKAVLWRSKGHCENPVCRNNKEPVGWTDSGDPILEVDHVVEHAAGGRDHGENMIALCPNCHALKTRGQKRAELTRSLVSVAADLHRAVMDRCA